MTQRSIRSRRPGTEGGKWSPVGPLRVSLPPITLPGGDEARMGFVPALGEHTGSLLRAAGMTDEEVAAVRREGVVA